MFVLSLFCSIKDYIDFKSKPTEGPQEPLCDPEIPSEVMVDHLPGLVHRDKLDYSPETGLRMVILLIILSYDIASGSEITPCNKIYKPLVVHRFSGNVMTSITMLST